MPFTRQDPPFVNQVDDPNGPRINATWHNKVDKGVGDAHDELANHVTALEDFTNEARNVIFLGGGTISWGAVVDKFKWTTRFLLMPVSDNVSSSRFVTLGMPTAGVTDAAGVERASVDGITLKPWESLWLIHTRGFTSGEGNSWKVLHYIDDALIAAYFNDENAFLVATRNGDASNGSLYVRNGLVVQAGRSIAEGQGAMFPTWGEVDQKPAAFAPSAHKTSHATGGADALTPADISAAPASHVGSTDGHPLATEAAPGFQSAADKAKINTRQALNILQYQGQISPANKPDPNDPDTWTWDEAVAAMVTDAKSLAAKNKPAGSFTFYESLPALYFPSGIYNLSSPIINTPVSGLLIYGDGLGATIIKHNFGGALIYASRGNRIYVEGVSIIGSLTENSCFFHAHQLTGDTTRGVDPTFMFGFENMELVSLHYGERYTGDVQCDMVYRRNVRYRDVFYGIELDNLQSVNHSWESGEYVFGVSTPSTYDPMALWSTPKQIADAAVIRLERGGQMKVGGGEVSIIGPMTTLYLIEPLAKGAIPAQVNSAPVTFDNVRWEMRAQDTVGDANGLERGTVIRYSNPYPAAQVRQQIRVIFKSCNWNCNYGYSSIDLFHLANNMMISLDACGIDNASAAKLVGLVNNNTNSVAGVFDSRLGDLLSHERRVSSDFTLGAGVNHRVMMRPGSKAESFGQTKAYSYHSDAQTLVLPVELLRFSTPYGHIQGSGGTQAARTFYFSPNHRLKKVTIVADTAPSTATTFRCRNSITPGQPGAKTYATLTLSTGVGTVTAEGVDNYRRVIAWPDATLDADGKVIFEYVGGGTAIILGYTEIEAA